MRTHRIAAIGGDGVGPEVIEAGLSVLSDLALREGFTLDVTRFDWGSDYYRRTGRMMPAEGVEQLKGFDAIYFGAVGDPDIPDHITLWDLRLAICQGLDQYANVRPTKLIGGMRGPLRPELGEQIDWVIVRENSEGEYAGVGGRAHAGLPIELAMDVAVFTRAGVERICRYACEIAMARPRKRLTVSIAAISFSAAAASPSRSSIIAPVQKAPIGLAMPLPMMSKAEPWIGSYMDGCFPDGSTLPVAPLPRLPVSAEARSERMSACRLLARIVSKLPGFVTIRAAMASTSFQSTSSSGKSFSTVRQASSQSTMPWRWALDLVTTVSRLRGRAIAISQA